MKPNIDMITVPVQDLKESERFYRELLELHDEQVASGEDHIAFFLENGISLVLFEQSEFARMTEQIGGLSRTSKLILTHNAGSNEEVDQILLKAKNAGAKILKAAAANEWSYSGYFKDPDGHTWEVLAWLRRNDG